MCCSYNQQVGVPVDVVAKQIFQQGLHMDQCICSNEEVTE